MKHAMTYLETGSLDPYYNLAFEEYILTHRMEGDILILWQNENTVVIGQNQIAEAEVDLQFVKEHGIKVVRRTTGGGAVYHDKGNLNYSFITEAGEMEEMTMERFARPVVEALQKLGLHAEISGRNDVLVNGCKVSGTAQRIYKNRILFHGTLLFDVDEEMVAGALRVDPLKFQGKHTKSVSSRIANIRSFLGEDMEMKDFWAHLRKEWGKEAVEGSVAKAEEEEILSLRNEKYATKEWNYRHLQQFDYSNKRKWNGGVLEARVAVQKETITNIVFYGDFLSKRPLEELERALIGRKFAQQEIQDVLSQVELKSYFGSISVQEILETVFMR